MNFESTSRKDDLISTFYLLATLINDNKFPCAPTGFNPLKEHSGMSTHDKFFTLKEIKQDYSLSVMA